MPSEREDGERFEFAERSKIMLGRAPGGKHELWWRVTVYVGDQREDIEAALQEALRIDRELKGAN